MKLASVPARRGNRWKAAAFLCLVVVMAGCLPQLDNARPADEPQVSASAQRGGQLGRTATSTRPAMARYDDRVLPKPNPVLSLVGAADFDVSGLTSAQRHWYERLWKAADASLGDMVDRVANDDSYDIGRWAFQFNHALLVGLRATGDLAFLDAVDEVAETIRGQLDDAWCGGVDRSVSLGARYGIVDEGDGYLNFRYRSGSSIHHCRDTSDLDEALTHGHLALLMHAYHVNRGNPSPRKIDYGERADFWLDYLINHFEPKWRGRSGVQWPDMDFIDLKFCHTYHQMLLYYAFVGWRLQDDGSPDAGPYLRQALRLTDAMFEVDYDRRERQPGGFTDVETPLGDAVVYSFGAPGATGVSDTHLEACPVTYARYMMTSILNLYLEGFPRWDDAIMGRLGHGIAHFVMDTDPVTDRPDPFAAGVAGDDGAAGIVPTEYRDRMSLSRYTITPFAALSRWETSGTMLRISLDAYAAWEGDVDLPQRVYIPASMLVVTTLDGDRALP